MKRFIRLIRKTLSLFVILLIVTIVIYPFSLHWNKHSMKSHTPALTTPREKGTTRLGVIYNHSNPRYHLENAINSVDDENLTAQTIRMFSAPSKMQFQDDTVIRRPTQLLPSNETSFCSIYHEFTDFQEGCFEQYQKFLQLYPSLPHVKQSQLSQKVIDALVNRMKRHTYKIYVREIASLHPQESCATNDCLYILKLSIDEFFMNNASLGGSRTSGGSGFRIMGYSDIIRHCGYRDHFNGTYSAFCPFSGNCVNVTVQLSHINFDAYKGTSRSHDEVVGSQDICLDEGVRASGQHRPDQQCQDSADVKDLRARVKVPGLWHQAVAGEDYFVTSQGHTLPLDPAFMCRCFNKTSFSLIGASHMKNAFLCAWNMCVKHVRTHVMRHVGFIRARYINETVAALHASSRRVKPGTRHVYVVQTGSWDLGFAGFRPTLSSTLVAFQQDLARFLEKKDRHVILVGTPSLPNESLQKLKLVSRNNEISAAFNHALRGVARALRLPFVDTLSVTLSRYRERPEEAGVAGHHYVLARCEGRVGQVALQMMLYDTCLDLATAADNGGQSWPDISHLM